MHQRICLVTSRVLTPGSAWGEAMRTLAANGHQIVVTSGTALPSDWPDQANPQAISANVRGFQSVQVISRSVLTEYKEYQFSGFYGETHSALLGMLSRVDSTGTYRSLEREVALRKIHLEIIGAVKHGEPTLGVFDVTPHEAVHYALMRFLEWKGIPLLMFQPSFVGHQVMARRSVTEPLPLALEPEVRVKHESVLDQIYELSESSIERLFRGTGTVEMDNQRSKEASVESVQSRLRALRYSVKRLRSPGPDVEFALTGQARIPNPLRRFAELFLERSLRLSLTHRIDQLPSLNDAPVGPFVLFALHYEPERSSVPEGAPFRSQIDAILAARAFIPASMTLYVKEHFSQRAAALRGFAGRSIDFYGLLESVPGVVVLGTDTNTRRLMQSAECVMTFTGKVGIEAAFEGTRAVYLGQPWWVGMPGAVDFNLLRQFEEIADFPKPDPDEVQRWLLRQIRGALLPGVSSVSPEEHSKKLQNLPSGFEEVEKEGILAAVAAVLSRAGGDHRNA